MLPTLANASGTTRAGVAVGAMLATDCAKTSQKPKQLRRRPESPIGMMPSVGMRGAVFAVWKSQENMLHRRSEHCGWLAVRSAARESRPAHNERDYQGD